MLNREIINKKGVTLIELLVALSIIAILFSAFSLFLTNAIRKVNLNSTMNDSMILLQKKLEYLYEKDFNSSELKNTIQSNDDNLIIQINDSAIVSNFSSYVSANFDHYEIVNFNRKRYYIFWNVKDETSLVKVIGITVYWRVNGDGHSVSALTFIRNKS